MLRCLPILLLLWPTLAMAQDDVAPTVRAVITDLHGQPLPTEMPLGEAIVFSARTSSADSGSVKWTILPRERDARKYVTPDGMDVFVPTGMTGVDITAILSVSKRVGDGSKSDHTTIAIRCGKGSLPPPDPDDDDTKPDTPKPSIDLPDGVFGLGDVSYRGKLLVISQDRAAEAKSLADAHSYVIGKSALQPFTLVSQLESEVAAKIAAKMDAAARARWEPWQDAIDARTTELQKAGKLRNTRDWIVAYDEIVQGLEAGEK